MVQDLSPIEQQYLEARRGAVRRILIWITAVNRDTGLPETIGFWNGKVNRTFVVEGQSRVFIAAGAAISFDDITSEPGEIVRTQQVTFSGVHPDVATAFRGFNAKLAQVQMYSAVFNMDTRNLVTVPRTIFEGEIDTTPMEDGAVSAEDEEGRSEITASLVSSSRSMTKTLPWFKSDAALRARAPVDDFRKNSATTSDRIVFWGSEQVRASDVATPSTPRKPSKAREPVR